MNSRPVCKLLLAVAVAVVLTGCASPMIQWAAAPSDTTASAARSFANSTRQQLQTAVKTQVDQNDNLGNTLIGMGAVISGLAYGHAHKDAMAGVGLIGGTAYAIGSRNYSAPRILVYQAGVDALNCAQSTVDSALDMEPDRNQIEKLLDGLANEVIDLKGAADDLQSAASKLADGSTLKQPALTIATAATTTAAAAQDKLINGRRLLAQSASAGKNLINAVQAIQGAVDRQVMATLPDLNSIQTVIKGLPTFVSGIAGAPIGNNLSDALSKISVAAPGSVSVKGLPDQPDLNDALVRVKTASSKVAIDILNLDSYITGHALSTASLFAGCAVAPVGPLTVSPTTVTATAGEAKTILITAKGGVKPYIFRLQEDPADGVKITSPTPFDSTGVLTLSVSAKAGTYHVLVVDSNQGGPDPVSIEIKIAAK